MTVLGSKQSLNQFKQTEVRGSEDELLNFNKITCQLNNPVASQITSAGDMFYMNAGSKGIPTVQEVSATDKSQDLMYKVKGFVCKNLKQSQYTGDMTVGVLLKGSVMNMIAEQPINSGDRVFYDARNGATAGMMKFSDINIETFKTINAGSLELSIDGKQVNCNDMNFEDVNTLADIANIINNAGVSAEGKCEAVNNQIVITSNTQGVDSSVDVLSTSGEVYEALNVLSAQTIDGEAAGVNQGKILPIQNDENPDEIEGIIECGHALNTTTAENQIVRVLIDFLY